MHAINTPSGAGFGRPWASEAAMEAGLAVAAAAFTLAVWLTSSAGPPAQQDATRQSAAGQPDSVQHVTLDPVLVRASAH